MIVLERPRIFPSNFVSEMIPEQGPPLHDEAKKAMEQEHRLRVVMGDTGAKLRTFRTGELVIQRWGRGRNQFVQKDIHTLGFGRQELTAKEREEYFGLAEVWRQKIVSVRVTHAYRNPYTQEDIPATSSVLLSEGKGLVAVQFYHEFVAVPSAVRENREPPQLPSGDNIGELIRYAANNASPVLYSKHTVYR